MKLEVVTDKSGLPLGVAAAAADVPESDLLLPALDDVPVPVPAGTPVVADKGHDSDPLRDDLEEAGFTPVIPHRWRVERTNAWLHCYRGLAVRWAYYPFMYVGLVYLSFIHLALQRF